MGLFLWKRLLKQPRQGYLINATAYSSRIAFTGFADAALST